MSARHGDRDETACGDGNRTSQRSLTPDGGRHGPGLDMADRHVQGDPHGLDALGRLREEVAALQGGHGARGELSGVRVDRTPESFIRSTPARSSPSQVPKYRASTLRASSSWSAKSLATEQSGQPAAPFRRLLFSICTSRQRSSPRGESSRCSSWGTAPRMSWPSGPGPSASGRPAPTHRCGRHLGGRGDGLRTSRPRRHPRRPRPPSGAPRVPRPAAGPSSSICCSSYAGSANRSTRWRPAIGPGHRAPHRGGAASAFQALPADRSGVSCTARTAGSTTARHSPEPKPPHGPPGGRYGPANCSNPIC
ncbi:hypothetical protein SAMN05216252_13414 [Actinacidiphila glaucinigra]|uniref:Uncharacterized protein n=1 Tax=Actinacidiphila glaucinigra TaxID=235986 RepID=A0A239NC66_9ACTN|nr:hypothetical protein SAMN05216252_13414 [Actinacidiphila glaucinigra]